MLNLRDNWHFEGGVVMYPGVWIGKDFINAKKKILILGESHYGDNAEMGKVTYTTKGVIESYLERHDIPFFTKIAKTFGYENYEEIRKFYNLVCFGNYVNVIVPKGSGQGKKFIEENRKIYNKELFDFCVNNSIDIIACFSMESYWNLPSEGEGLGTETIIREDRKSLKTRKWIYKKGTLENDSMILDKDLFVYGICHPSWQGGYDAKLEYEKYIKNQQELKWLCNKHAI